MGIPTCSINSRLEDDDGRSMQSVFDQAHGPIHRSLCIVQCEDAFLDEARTELITNIYHLLYLSFQYCYTTI